MNTDCESLPVSQQLSRLLDFTGVGQSSQALLPLLKQYLETSQNSLQHSFVANTNIRKLVHTRSRHIDKLLITVADHLGLSDSVALIAVGGYGRGELHPHSDIDLLVLSEAPLETHDQQCLEQLISMLWDCRLKVGQSVRLLSQCVDMAKNDVTIATNLMESRLLKGPNALFDSLKKQTSPKAMWDAKSFFEAKTAEQRARYKKYDGTSFDLEPNVKSSPGGLRDIHVISWIAQRMFYPRLIEELVQQNVITKKEYYTLVKCQLYIWRVRYALHLASGKPEDRLLFDYQKSAAKLMGFKDTRHTMAVEKMMKRYYRSVLIIRNICDILLQVLEQQLSKESSRDKVQVIDDDYQIINQRLETIEPKLFVKTPSQLLRVFQYVARNPELKGIGAQTLRAIRAARYKITPSFRNKKDNKELFVAFWHILHTSSRAMFLMKRSGVLADYLQAFAQITGQMQYDMFHNYTVDEHTLFLLKNLSEFADPANNAHFPLCSEIMQRQKNPEIIFLAGLFHDIAKGRGGDHSELGAMEVRQFCEHHQLPQEHADVIEWLVANHLVMSLMAQKRDISDPKVIENFAAMVKNQQRLELLYILTVADIRATSHSLWNSWKDSLLKNLYISTAAYLDETTAMEVTGWKKVRSSAKQQLLDQGIGESELNELWQNLDESYFDKRNVETICWQMHTILDRHEPHAPVVEIRTNPEQSGSEVFIYSPDKKNLFAALTTSLNQQGLSIQAANIYTDKNGFAYDSFVVLDAAGETLENPRLIDTIKKAIVTNISDSENMKLSVQRRMPRQFKYFSIPVQVDFIDDEYSGYTRLELVARDEPGLLAAVGKAFVASGIRLHDARINTLGEKVEDIFIISTDDDQPINDETLRAQIRKEILTQLEN